MKKYHFKQSRAGRCPLGISLEDNQGKEKANMAKKVTSKSVASKASKVLRDGRTSKDSKSCAGSALSQREKKK